MREDAPPEPAVTVLVVDDQPLFRNAARTVIARTAGFVLVGEAVDGRDAIEQVDALRPQLVLMDIHMPLLDGIDATRRITAAHPTVAVVLLSSYDQADLPLEVEDSGALAYLHKEELAPAAVRALWARHGSRDA